MANAALLSLSHILEKTLHHDNQYLIHDEKQKISFLLEKVRFLQQAIESLESQITDAAYKVEEIIESHIRHRVVEESKDRMEKSFFSLSILETTLFQDVLEKVTKEIDTITKMVDNNLDETDVQDLHPRTSSLVSSSKHPSSGKSNMVGLDDNLMVINQLTGGSSNLKTLSIVGMGGIGKTTLAKKVYDDELILYHFHIRAWVTVTQDYNMREIFISLLDSMEIHTIQDREKSTEKSEVLYKECEKTTEELEEVLYKKLKGRRYLIVIDDVWDIKAWDRVRRMFPNDKNGSRIMMTTRLEKVARNASPCSPPHQMRFLNEEESWNLFCANVFGKDRCPPELKQIGKKIIQNCRGLPLAIVVTAGLLSKDKRTVHHWTNVGENLSSVIASNDDQQCSKILSLSYKNLPHHLKGCFLYFGIFQEDSDINVSTLFKLWIAEGFIESAEHKTLEDMAEENLFDLVGRNLILVSERSSKGKIKKCKIHDLLRDLCVREAQREKLKGRSLRHLNLQGDVDHPTNELPKFLLQSLSNFGRYVPAKFLTGMPVRVLDAGYITLFPTEMEEVVDLQFLAYNCNDGNLPASVYKLRYLQTLILYEATVPVYLSPEIWTMTQLRHLQLGEMILPDTVEASPVEASPVEASPEICAEIEAENSVTALENLQTLSTVLNFRCTEEILKRIPNLKKLGICLENVPMDWEYLTLKNLVHLHQLESLKFLFLTATRSFLHNIIFPSSLKKLTLDGCSIPWEELTIIGKLHIEVLKLRNFALYVLRQEWEPNEEEFLQLKYLLLENVRLQHWRADSVHFPRLENLVIKNCHSLEEIPSEIGDIPTLQTIELHYCKCSLVTSAKKIKEEQQNNGNDDLQILYL